jgi:hypothetical protein
MLAALAFLMTGFFAADIASARLLATRSVGFLVDRDVITVDRRLRTIDIDIRDNPVRITSVTVVFGDGRSPSRKTFKGGRYEPGHSTPAYSWGRRRLVSEIIIYYATVAPFTFNTAHVLINGR